MLTDSERVAERLRAALLDSKVSDVQLASECGVTKQAITGWKKTGRIAKKHLPTVAALTHKPVEYFLLQEVDHIKPAKPSASDGPANALTLNALEHQLLAFFRGMSADHRDDLIVLANRWFIHDNPGPPSVADPYPKQRKKAKA